MNSVIRKTIVGFYVVGFWVLFPALIVKMSSSLDRSGLRKNFPFLIKLIGIVVSLASAILLGKAIKDFTAGAGKLPVTAISPYNRLAHKGLYSIWRHPIYLFYTLLMVGIALIAGSGGFLLVVLPVYSFIIILHAGIEELYLAKKHGYAYKRYYKSTAILIPKVRYENMIEKIFRGNNRLPLN